MGDLFSTGIRPLVDAHIQKLSEEERNYGDYWSASSAGKCYRLQVLTRLGVPPSPEMQDGRAIRQRTFSVGHIFHEWIQGITKDAGLSIAQELELQDEDLMVRGHIDDLVLVNPTYTLKPPTKETAKVTVISQEDWEKAGPIAPPDLSKLKQHLILYDYKTVHSDYFHYAREKIGYYHKMQLGTYMYMMQPKGKKTFMLEAGQEIPLGVQEARRLNISKDDLRMSENQLIWDDNLEKEVLDYWKGLNKVWEARKMPPCTCHLEDGGFMARRSKKGKIFNDYFYEEKPCNLDWFEQWKSNKKEEA